MIRSRMAWAVATEPVAIGRGARVVADHQRKLAEDGALEFDELILVLRAGQRWNGHWAFETRFLPWLVLIWSSCSRAIRLDDCHLLGYQHYCKTYAGLHIWQGVASRRPGLLIFLEEIFLINSLGVLAVEGFAALMFRVGGVW